MESFFDLSRLALQHVEEVGIAAGVELIGAVEADAAIGEQPRQRAMDDGCADLALDVVADDRQAGVAEFLRPIRDRRRGRPGTQLTIATPASRQACA